MDTLRQNATHEVVNQATPLEGTNFFDIDLALQEALEREGGGWAVDRARDTGAVAGSAEAQEHGRRAERNEPRLQSPTTATGTASTTSTSTRRGTGCCAARSSARSTRCRGATRARARTSPARR